jgi:alpha/beta superfamily hydrolase
MSEGEYISLGYFEQEDVLTVVNHLRNNERIEAIGLWGRSMGAVTAILACRRSAELNVIVCDSPFTSLKRICQDLAWKQYHIPCCLFSMLFCCLRSKV